MGTNNSGSPKPYVNSNNGHNLNHTISTQSGPPVSSVLGGTGSTVSERAANAQIAGGVTKEQREHISHSYADMQKIHAEAYRKAKGDDEGEGITFMLKNLPNKYTRDTLIERLQKDYRYDMSFLYMPVDFTTSCNVGYCFINLRTREAADRFQKQYDNTHTRVSFPGYNSNKVAQVNIAAVQGLHANLERLKKSPLLPVMKRNVGWQPILFDAIGTLIP